jgi:hypothetical protein
MTVVAGGYLVWFGFSLLLLAGDLRHDCVERNLAELLWRWVLTVAAPVVIVAVACGLLVELLRAVRVCGGRIYLKAETDPSAGFGD